MSAIIVTSSPTRPTPTRINTNTSSKLKSSTPTKSSKSPHGTNVSISAPSGISPYPNSSTSSAPNNSTNNERTPLLGQNRVGEGHRIEPLINSLSTPHFLTCLLGVFSANFVFAFQVTSIPTLAPGISSGFQHAELGSYLGSGFTLANTAVMPVYGVIMETLGRKVAMLIACIFFGLGTVFCGISTNIYALIAARAFAGLGGGGLLTVSSVIVTDLVSLADRGIYQGIMMIIFGAGTMLGGPLSGWLNDRFGWQWSFWVQIPIVLFCMLIVSIFLPPSPIPPTHPTLLSGLRSLDWIGTGLLITSVTSLILGFSFHTSYLQPWSSPVVWGMLLLAAITGPLFVWVEGWYATNPIVDLKNLKSRHRSAIMASGFFLSAANQAFAFYVPVYFAVIVNTSTAQAGMINSMCGGLGAVGGLLAGQHIRRNGKYRLLGILSLFPPAIGSFVAVFWRPDWAWKWYYLTVMPMNLGYSVFLTCQLIALVSAVDSKTMPKATALLYTIRSLGGTLGVSSAGSIQIGTLTSALNRKFAGLPNRDELIYAILHSKSAIRTLPPDLQTKALHAYATSLRTVWTIAGCVAMLTILSSLFVQQKQVHAPADKAVEGREDGREA